MPQAIEVISGFVTAPSSTFTAWTNATGNSNQIRNADVTSKVRLIGAWAQNNAAGVLRVRSPRLHDNVQGIRMRVNAADSEPIYPGVTEGGFAQPLIPQDTLTIEQTGSAVGGQIETGSLLVWYENLPAIAARLIDVPTLMKLGLNDMGQEVSVTTSGSGGYSGQVAINVTNDNFKANTDYALLGAVTDTRVSTIRIQGIDTGNLGLGIPGEPTQRHVGVNWFQRLSGTFGLPLIPVFNSANKSAILVDCLGNQAGVTAVLTFHMIELPPNAVPLAGQSK